MPRKSESTPSVSVELTDADPKRHVIRFNYEGSEVNPAIGNVYLSREAATLLGLDNNGGNGVRVTITAL